MASKEEKLAAARKKLKEFQGKSKDLHNKKNSANQSSVESSPSCSPFPLNGKKFTGDVQNLNSALVNLPDYQDHSAAIELNSLASKETTNSISSLNVEQNSCSDDSFSVHNVNSSSAISGQQLPWNFNSFDNSNEEGKNGQQVLINKEVNEPTKDISLNDAFHYQPLHQSQLQSHIQTISILVAERNDLQATLNGAHNLLHEKAEELKEANNKLTSSVVKNKELENRIMNLENLIENLHLDREELIKKLNDGKVELERLRMDVESKEEEHSELIQKWESKTRECDHLLQSLQQAQAQLSMYQIKVQQLNIAAEAKEETVTSNFEIAKLQLEKESLLKKLENLEKELESSNCEKEQSSQNFHVYAQQCNTQLNYLNSQIKELTLEKQSFQERNSKLEKKVEELSNQLLMCKQQLETQENQESTESKTIQGEINTLTEENVLLRSELSEKDKELKVLEKELQLKIEELNNLESMMEEMRSDKTRLLSEIESNAGNDRLLAAMESDKVAAARAVSQNQKLKEQLHELEQGFIKLSHEKLELTDQLAHEKHINKELSARIDSSHRRHHDHDDDHHHHRHRDGCESEECPEPMVNDSAEIEELRNIIRQLQDDKTELLSRLGNSSLRRTSDGEKRERDVDGEQQCENAKLLLQQMEEKVKKTMNEIAVLDEEKQKLEHLVLQLQGETETIGEYISLYQKQRMLLRQRTKEKDDQLIQLSKDKEELKSKLSTLDSLVQHLLAEKNNVTNGIVEDKKNVSDDKIELHENKLSESTAGKIRELITEIGSTSLVSGHSVAFGHCPCCSGRLITI